MKRGLLFLPLMALGCGGGGNPENNPLCGFASVAGANMVLEQLRGTARALDQAPAEVVGTIPTRVVGYGTTPSVAGVGGMGVVIGFQGLAFPARPGFGLILVEDSADTFKGVLVYDIDPPLGFPQLGTISSATSTLPVYGMRVNWRAVSDPSCPLFGPIEADSSEQ